jgi:ribonuclease VapC
LVLDSYALLAFFQAEPSARVVRELMSRGNQGEGRLVMSVINVGEVFYKTVRNHGLERAEEVLGLIDGYPIELIGIHRELALAAARLKSTYRMSYADCFAAALAQQLDAVVVTGDPDFQQLEGRVDIEWLPVDGT